MPEVLNGGQDLRIMILWSGNLTAQNVSLDVYFNYSRPLTRTVVRYPNRLARWPSEVAKETG